jgi:hypothetical protein
MIKKLAILVAYTCAIFGNPQRIEVQPAAQQQPAAAPALRQVVVQQVQVAPAPIANQQQRPDLFHRISGGFFDPEQNPIRARWCSRACFSAAAIGGGFLMYMIIQGPMLHKRYFWEGASGYTAYGPR